MNSLKKKSLQKSVFRQKVKKRLKVLSDEQKQAYSEVIQSRLMTLHKYQKAQSVLLYMPLANEVKIKLLIEKSLKLGQRVYLPKMCKNALEAVLYQEGSKLQKNSFGVKEPVLADHHSILNYYQADVDLVVLPGLAFDRNFNRLGRGLGCYDRYMAQHQASYYIGVCYQAQLFSDIPHQKHDQKVDCLFSEKMILIK